MIETYPTPATCGSLPAERASAGEGREIDSDATLMARVAEDGDRVAFGLLVDRYASPLVAYLSRLTGYPERAQDLAQESFLRLYRAAPGYRDRGYFRAYLYRIATNLVRSEERKAKQWRLLTGLLPSSGDRAGRTYHEADAAADAPAMAGSLWWWTGGTSDDAEGLTLQKERQRLLAQAVAALPLPYRAVLVLSEVDELPHREIAALIGCREGTVKSRLHRARQRLRERLEPYWAGIEAHQAVGERP